MANTDAVTINFTDVAGNVGQMRGRMLSSASDAAVTAALDALQALSDLRLNSWTRAKEHSYAGTGPVAPGTGHKYADNVAKVVTTFQTGNTVVKPKLEIFGPIESVVGGNDGSIDPANALWDDLETAAIAVMTARGGTPVTALQMGHIIVKHLRHSDG